MQCLLMCFFGVSFFEIVGIVSYRDAVAACFPPCLKYQLLAAKSCTVNATSNVKLFFLFFVVQRASTHLKSCPGSRVQGVVP